LIKKFTIVSQRKFSDERITRARALFAKYDKDGDGTINNQELKRIYEELGKKPSPELMKQLDPDGNGSISFMEFVNAYEIWAEILVQPERSGEEGYKGSRVKLTQEQMEKARETFSKYDEDNDGRIPSHELHVKYAGLLAEICSAEEANKRATSLLKFIDADGDGKR
jgi:Ca2+-binding EF-hand superfamily protein